MINKSKIYSFLGSAALACIALYGCSTTGIDPDVIDGIETRTVYLDTPDPDNVLASKVVTTNGEETSGTTITLPYVYVSGPAKNDIVVSLAIDNTLLDEYLQSSGLTATELPSSVTASLTSQVTISAGSQISSTQPRITLTWASLPAEGLYVIPVKITSITQTDGVQLTTDKNLVYASLLISENAYSNAFSTPGVAIANDVYPTWTVTANPGITNGNNMLRINTSGYAQINPPVETELVFDMQEVYDDISGYRFRMYSSSYIFTRARVETSVDGINWTYQGTPQFRTGDYLYVPFYENVEARYVRFTILEWGSRIQQFVFYYIQAYRR